MAPPVQTPVPDTSPPSPTKTSLAAFCNTASLTLPSPLTPGSLLALIIGTVNFDLLHLPTLIQDLLSSATALVADTESSTATYTQASSSPPSFMLDNAVLQYQAKTDVEIDGSPLAITHGSISVAWTDATTLQIDTSGASQDGHSTFSVHCTARDASAPVLGPASSTPAPGTYSLATFLTTFCEIPDPDLSNKTFTQLLELMSRTPSESSAFMNRRLPATLTTGGGPTLLTLPIDPGKSTATVYNVADQTFSIVLGFDASSLVAEALGVPPLALQAGAAITLTQDDPHLVGRELDNLTFDFKADVVCNAVAFKSSIHCGPVLDLRRAQPVSWVFASATETTALSAVLALVDDGKAASELDPAPVPMMFDTAKLADLSTSSAEFEVVFGPDGAQSLRLFADVQFPAGLASKWRAAFPGLPANDALSNEGEVRILNVMNPSEREIIIALPVALAVKSNANSPALCNAQLEVSQYISSSKSAIALAIAFAAAPQVGIATAAQIFDSLALDNTAIKSLSEEYPSFAGAPLKLQSMRVDMTLDNDNALVPETVTMSLIGAGQDPSKFGDAELSLITGSATYNLQSKAWACMVDANVHIAGAILPCSIAIPTVGTDGHLTINGAVDGPLALSKLLPTLPSQGMQEVLVALDSAKISSCRVSLTTPAYGDSPNARSGSAFIVVPAQLLVAGLAITSAVVNIAVDLSSDGKTYGLINIDMTGVIAAETTNLNTRVTYNYASGGAESSSTSGLSIVFTPSGANTSFTGSAIAAALSLPAPSDPASIWAQASRWRLGLATVTLDPMTLAVKSISAKTIGDVTLDGVVLSSPQLSVGPAADAARKLLDQVEVYNISPLPSGGRVAARSSLRSPSNKYKLTIAPSDGTINITQVGSSSTTPMFTRVTIAPSPNSAPACFQYSQNHIKLKTAQDTDFWQDGLIATRPGLVAFVLTDTGAAYVTDNPNDAAAIRFALNPVSVGSQLAMPGSGSAAPSFIAVGQCLESANGAWRLFVQTDGNMVRYEAATVRATWASGTWRKLADRLALGSDGSLQLLQYRGNWGALWKADNVPSLQPGEVRVVTLQNDSSLVMTSGGNVIWKLDP